MEIIHALVLSIVEGVTEFLPISSTGHLVLTSNLLGIPQTEFLKSFEIFIQLGAILAVVVLYYKTLINNLKLLKPLFIAFLPTAILGLIFYKIIKTYLLGNLLVTLLALLIGGIVLVIIEKFIKQKNKPDIALEKLTNKQALIIGLAQSVSMIPGVSRAAATIIGGMFLGLNRRQATEFSFMLAIPTMMAATGLDLIKSNYNFAGDQITALLIGFLGSFITALFSIKFLVKYLQNHSFFAFGVYRIIIAIAFWLIIAR